MLDPLNLHAARWFPHLETSIEGIQLGMFSKTSGYRPRIIPLISKNYPMNTPWIPISQVFIGYFFLADPPARLCWLVGKWTWIVLRRLDDGWSIIGISWDLWGVKNEINGSIFDSNGSIYVYSSYIPANDWQSDIWLSLKREYTVNRGYFHGENDGDEALDFEVLFFLINPFGWSFQVICWFSIQSSGKMMIPNWLPYFWAWSELATNLVRFRFKGGDAALGAVYCDRGMELGTSVEPQIGCVSNVATSRNVWHKLLVLSRLTWGLGTFRSIVVEGEFHPCIARYLQIMFAAQ